MKKLMILAAVAIVAVGCNKNEETTLNNKVEAQFQNGVITRAVDDTWSVGDKVGIYMVKTGQTLADATIAEGAKNIQHNVGAAGKSGTFTANATAETIYFPVDGSGVDFYAYYPYSPAVSTAHTVAINVADQTNQEAIDVMTAVKVVGKTKTAPAVALNFKHRLAKLAFTITNGEGITAADLTNLTVKVQGMPTVATYALATDVMSTPTTVADITMKTATNGLSTEAIIIPVSATANSKIAFTLAGTGEVFYWDISATAFEAGNKYEYTVTVTRTGVEFSGATITPWVVNNGGGVNAE